MLSPAHKMVIIQDKKKLREARRANAQKQRKTKKAKTAYTRTIREVNHTFTKKEVNSTCSTRANFKSNAERIK